MLDVHPPHSPTHSWKDFFLHIATIVVGLLIAVGLEQTVEAIHRTHERKVLIEDIHAEAEHNIHVFDDNIMKNAAVRAWAKASILAIDSAVQQSSTPDARGRGSITVQLPSGAAIAVDHAPSRAVWSVAKSNGKVALLPENLAEVYDRLDYDAEQFMQARESRAKALVDIRAFEIRYGTAVRPDTTLHLPLTALDEFTQLLARYAASCTEVNDWTGWWAGAGDSVLHDVQTRDEMVPYLDRHHADLPQ